MRNPPAESGPRKAPEVGFDVPALPGMAAGEVETPCLVLDLDALERNVAKLGRLLRERGVRHRAHCKTHRSVDVARLQIELGGACGICCQKLSEAEVFARAGFRDILVSHEVVAPAKIERLARMPLLGARTLVLVDDEANVADLAAAARRNGTTIECLVELDCGGGLCGVATAGEAVRLARLVAEAPALRFAGIQAYHGRMQHFERHEERREAAAGAAARAREAVEALRAAGLDCGIVGGGGTGSWEFDADSGVYNELQCGSYAFLDDEYGRILDASGARLDRSDGGAWENALFVLTTVVSRTKAANAVCDAGLKVMSFEAGPPAVFGRDGVRYVRWADEHGLLEDPAGSLRVGDRLLLVPAHCDPTCNLHDWYVGLRDRSVECVWPVSARGKSW